MFQLDGSKSLHEKWLFHQTSLKLGCLGYQVYIVSHDSKKEVVEKKHPCHVPSNTELQNTFSDFFR